MSQRIGRLFGIAILVVGLASVGHSKDRDNEHAKRKGHPHGQQDRQPGQASHAPEIDLSSGANALALLAGGLLVIRGRRRANRE